MSRFAQERRVYFFEEPIYDREFPSIEISEVEPNLMVCTPFIPKKEALRTEPYLRQMFDILERDEGVRHPVLWVYAPMMFRAAMDLDPELVVYDCMDEPTASLGAPSELGVRECELLRRADVVFAGGPSLYQRKRAVHGRVTNAPSSVDVTLFGRARELLPPPRDQPATERPRIGLSGVIDERVNLTLLDEVSRQRPSYDFVVIGPVANIDPSMLPSRPNLHFLGPKPYRELPAYLAGWDVAMMPFALNDSTRFHCPTKTLEYLAAGKQVVATAVHDVVNPYGILGVVRIADAATFPDSIDEALAADPHLHRVRCDAILERTSWDSTFHDMKAALQSLHAPVIALGS